MKNSSCIIIALLLLIIYIQSSNEPFRFMNRFALSGDITTDINEIIPTNYYLVGTRTKSNTIIPAQNGGTECPEFPVTVYKVAEPKKASCVVESGNINEITDDMGLYSFSETAVPGVNIFPRFFTTNIIINIPVTTATTDTATKSISYNTNGNVLIVGNTSGMVYWSSNFGTATQSFNPMNSGVVTFNNASIGMGNTFVGGRLTPTNDNLLYIGNTSSSINPIYNGSSYFFGTQQAVGTVTNIQGYNGTPDNVLMTLGTDGQVYVQQQGAYYYRQVLSQSPSKASSISLDQTVATAVYYTAASGSTLATSTIFMVSMQAGSLVAKAPGGIGAEISTLSGGGWKKVVGNPNDIMYVCAGEDLRAFAINSKGNLLICNNITKAGAPADWVVLPLDKTPPKFKQVFYRSTANDIAYALDTNGKVYVQKGVNAMFKQMFNLTV